MLPFDAFCDSLFVPVIEVNIGLRRDRVFAVSGFSKLLHPSHGGVAGPDTG